MTRRAGRLGWFTGVLGPILIAGAIAFISYPGDSVAGRDGHSEKLASSGEGLSERTVELSLRVAVSRGKGGRTDQCKRIKRIMRRKAVVLTRPGGAGSASRSSPARR